MASLVSRTRHRLIGCIRSLSTTRAPFSSKTADLSKLVSGLSPEDVEANESIAEFLRANFENESDEIEDGFVIPEEVLKEFGVTDSDFPAPEKGSQKEYGAPRIDKGLGSPEQQALNIRTLHTFIRQEEGSNACRRLRENKIIPGMLYGGNPNLGIDPTNSQSKTLLKTPWQELQRELDRFHRRFESRVYDLTVYENDGDTEGQIHRVVPRNVQRHPVQGSIYCANFVRYYPGRPLKIPIVYVNTEESAALKRDGFIVPVSKHVECIVDDGVAIPEAIELECTGVQLKEVLRMDRLIFPDGVRPTKRVDPDKFVVGPVVGGRGSGDDAGDEAESTGSEEE